MPAYRMNTRYSANRVGAKKRTRKYAKKTYKKRSSRKTGYRKKSYPTGQSAASELAVYKNPFSVKTQQPRIPDGSRNHSLGVSYRTHLGSIDPESRSAYCVLFPGAGTFGTVLKSTDKVEIAAMHASTKIVMNAEMEAWRGVSFGMKIRNISNSLENGGTWQAIRLRPCVLATEGVIPPTVIPPIADWANDPSFSSGRLRDIGRKDFICATENDEHLWVNAKDSPYLLSDSSFDIVVVYVSDVEQISVDFFGNYEMTFVPQSAVNMFQLKTNQVMPKVLASAQIAKRKKCSRAAS